MFHWALFLVMIVVFGLYNTAVSRTGISEFNSRSSKIIVLLCSLAAVTIFSRLPMMIIGAPPIMVMPMFFITAALCLMASSISLIFLNTRMRDRILDKHEWQIDRTYVFLTLIVLLFNVIYFAITLAGITTNEFDFLSMGFPIFPSWPRYQRKIEVIIEIHLEYIAEDETRNARLN